MIHPIYIVNVTYYGREQAVADAIRAMGYDAWVPVEVRTYRKSRKSPERTAAEYPLIPAMLFAEVPEAAHGDLQDVRCFDSLERDSFWRPLEVPRMQYLRFKCYVEDWNEVELMRIKSNSGAKPAKKKWQRLDRDNLQGVLAALFGGAT